jgi:hypothetical protein
VLVRILSCLALLNAAVMAQPGFLLGADYSEWLYPNAGQMQIATDGSGALYILSVLPGTSLSSQPVFRVTKLSADFGERRAFGALHHREHFRFLVARLTLRGRTRMNLGCH